MDGDLAVLGNEVEQFLRMPLPSNGTPRSLNGSYSSTSHRDVPQHAGRRRSDDGSVGASSNRSKPLPKSIERSMQRQRRQPPPSSLPHSHATSPHVFTFRSTTPSDFHDGGSRVSSSGGPSRVPGRREDYEHLIAPVDDFSAEVRSTGGGSMYSAARTATPRSQHQQELEGLRRQVEELQRSFLSGRASESMVTEETQPLSSSLQQAPQQQGHQQRHQLQQSPEPIYHPTSVSTSRVSDSFNQLNGDIDVLQAELSATRDELAVTKRVKGRLESELSVARQAAYSNADRTGLEHEVSRLQLLLNTAGAERADYESQANNAEAAYQQLQQTIVQKEREWTLRLADLESELSRARLATAAAERKKAVPSSSATEDAAMAAFGAELEATSTAKATIERELKLNKAERERLRKELAALSNTHKLSVQELNEVSEQAEELLNELEAAHKDKDAAVQELETLKRRRALGLGDESFTAKDTDKDALNDSSAVDIAVASVSANWEQRLKEEVEECKKQYQEQVQTEVEELTGKIRAECNAEKEAALFEQQEEWQARLNAAIEERKNEEDKLVKKARKEQQRATEAEFQALIHDLQEDFEASSTSREYEARQRGRADAHRSLKGLIEVAKQEGASDAEKRLRHDFELAKEAAVAEAERKARSEAQKHFNAELERQREYLTRSAEAAAAIEKEGAIAKAVQEAEKKVQAELDTRWKAHLKDRLALATKQAEESVRLEVTNELRGKFNSELAKDVAAARAKAKEAALAEAQLEKDRAVRAASLAAREQGRKEAKAEFEAMLSTRVHTVSAQVERRVRLDATAAADKKWKALLHEYREDWVREQDAAIASAVADAELEAEEAVTRRLRKVYEERLAAREGAAGAKAAQEAEERLRQSLEEEWAERLDKERSRLRAEAEASLAAQRVADKEQWEKRRKEWTDSWEAELEERLQELKALAEAEKGKIEKDAEQRLKEAEEQFAAALEEERQQLQGSIDQAVEKEKLRQSEDYAASLRSVESNFTAELQKVQGQNEEALERLREQHRAEVEELKRSHSTEKQSWHRKRKEETKELRSMLEAELDRVRAEGERNVAEAKEDGEAELRRLRAEVERLKRELEDTSRVTQATQEAVQDALQAQEKELQDKLAEEVQRAEEQARARAEEDFQSQLEEAKEEWQNSQSSTFNAKIQELKRQQAASSQASLDRLRTEMEAKAEASYAEGVKQGRSQVEGTLEGVQKELRAMKQEKDTYLRAYRAEARKRRAADSRVMDLQGNIRVHARVRPTDGMLELLNTGDIRSTAELRKAAASITFYSKGGAPTPAAHGAEAPPSPSSTLSSSEEPQRRVHRHKERLQHLQDLIGRGVLQYGGPGQLFMKAALDATRTSGFEFDDVYPPGAEQTEVFQAVEPLCVALLEGYNVCVLAYGQTGSGKTYTLEGTVEKPGVTLRALARLFSLYNDPPSAPDGLPWDYKFEISVMEVYNEKVGDLLAHLPASQLQYSAATDGQVTEKATDVESVMAALAAADAPDSPAEASMDGAHGAARGGVGGYKGTVAASRRWGVMGPPQGQKASLVVREGRSGSEVVNLQRVPVATAPHALRLIHLASRARAVASHRMNVSSSRSHMIVRIWCTAYNKDETDSESKDAESFKSKPKSKSNSNIAFVSEMNLVDLAGSERVLKSEASGQRLEEAKSINKSLSALGDVISAHRLRSLHVPYRNSKLTFVLKNALKGDAKVMMFINVSAEPSDASESLCSLQFGQRCRSVALGAAPPLFLHSSDFDGSGSGSGKRPQRTSASLQRKPRSGGSSFHLQEAGETHSVESATLLAAAADASEDDDEEDRG